MTAKRQGWMVYLPADIRPLVQSTMKHGETFGGKIAELVRKQLEGDSQ